MHVTFFQIAIDNQYEDKMHEASRSSQGQVRKQKTLIAFIENIKSMYVLFKFCPSAITRPKTFIQLLSHALHI